MNEPIFDLSCSPVSIPQRFHGVTYNYDHFPGAAETNGLNGGVNCQQYVYELLRHFGFIIPDFRSSDLWDDRQHTTFADRMALFDIVMVHMGPHAYGAHVGLCLGGDLVLHLSKKIGVPAIETLSAMTTRTEYKYLIGAKRVLFRRQDGPAT